MNSNVNMESLAGASGLLATGFVLLALGGVFVYALWRERARRANCLALAASALLAACFGVGLAFSMASAERDSGPTSLDTFLSEGFRRAKVFVAGGAR